MASSKNQVSSGSFLSSPPCFYETPVPIHGRSKSQMCLRKIMEIILYDSSTTCLIKPCNFLKPPWWKLEKRQSENIETDDERKKPVERVSCKENEQNIDLRLGHLEIKEEVNLREDRDFDGDSDSVCCEVGEVGEFAGKVCRINCNSSVESAVEKSSQGEHDLKSGENLLEIFGPDGGGEEGMEFSEIRILQSSQGKCDERRSSDADDELVHADENEKAREEEVEEKNDEITDEVEGGKRRRRSEGYLDLLIEAIRLVSGNLIEVEKVSDIETDSIPVKSKSSPSSNNNNNNNNNKRSWWMLEDLFEDSAPVVKSKRGRSQILPSRFRDSVLEPWKRLPRLPRSKRSKP